VHDWLVAIVCLMRNDGFRLREWEESDAEVLLAAYAGAGMETERPEDVATIEDAKRLIAGWAEDAVADRAYTFAVVDGADILGQMRVTTQMRVHSIGWISYWTLEKHRGRGVGSTGLKLLARHCFDELDLFRLETGHRIDNPGSCRVATAAGFLVEGRERQKLLYDGVRYDTETHARLATDPDPA
jgi:[ribosomal protein S5]-alanine N-acetyltransferase